MVVTSVRGCRPWLRGHGYVGMDPERTGHPRVVILKSLFKKESPSGLD